MTVGEHWGKNQGNGESARERERERGWGGREAKKKKLGKNPVIRQSICQQNQPDQGDYTTLYYIPIQTEELRSVVN